MKITDEEFDSLPEFARKNIDWLWSRIKSQQDQIASYHNLVNKSYMHGIRRVLSLLVRNEPRRSWELPDDVARIDSVVMKEIDDMRKG